MPVRRGLIAGAALAPIALLAWTCRTGYVMPLLYGARRWLAARP